MTDPILAPVAALTLPDSAALAGRAQQALAFIESFTIASDEDYGLAAEELRAIKTRINALEAQRTGITGPINKALKAINDLFSGPANLLVLGEHALKQKMLAWTTEQERLAAEDRRRAEEAAAAERRRLEAEAAERQAEAQRKAEEAAAAQQAGDVQAAAIAQAAADRAHAEAQTVSETAQMVIAPVLAVAKPAAKGIATTTRIDFEVQDLHALVRHVAAHPELLSLVRADDVKLRAFVRGLGTACNLPGVRVFEDRGISARAA